MTVLYGVASPVLLWEDLAAKIKDRKWARNADRLACRDYGQVPTTNQAQKSEASGYVQQFCDMSSICFGYGRSDREVRCSNEGKQHDQPEKGKRKERVYAERGDQENETTDCPATSCQLSELQREESDKVLTLRRCGILAKHCKGRRELRLPRQRQT